MFDRKSNIVSQAQQEFPQQMPSPGHVEHDPEAIWDSQLRTARAAMRRAKAKATDLAAIGITNQRETIVLWERDTGKPIDNAQVWQSRITAPQCDKLKAAGHEEMIREKTGLVIDPYFSGTKIAHLLKKHKLYARARRGEILAGTIDTFLMWRLTGGQIHATDYSNASRTLIYNIHTLGWDDQLLALLKVPREVLPEVRDSSGEFGITDKKILGGEVAIAGVAGDQQAATFGQGCFQTGMAKNTYGTGCFLLMNTGQQPVASKHGLLTTIGWGIGGKITYCLEGSIFVGGAAVQWLRDGLGLINKSSDIEELAASEQDAGGLFFVPAMVGLGAPHWDPYARGMIIGIERSTTRGHLAHATLESMAYQTVDVIDAMQADSGVKLKKLRVDGGAAINNQLMQFQADMLGKVVERPVVYETTALGAAYLAGLAVGYWKSQSALAKAWQLDREFTSTAKPTLRKKQIADWRRAVQRSQGWASPN